MRRFAIGIFAVMVVLEMPCQAMELDFRSAPILKDTLTHYIRPSYAVFADRVSGLEAATSKLCETASPRDLETARDSFTRVVDAWSRVEWLRTGPVMSENRLERVLFYPDRKSTGLKQVQRVLVAENEEMTDPGALSGADLACLPGLDGC